MSNSDTSEGTTVKFDRRTTELDALQRAAYALANIMSVDIRVDGDEFFCHLADLAGLNIGAAEARLRREVFDQTLRIRIGRETEQIRNLIFAVAFSQTGLVGGDVGVEGEPIGGAQ